MAKQVEWFKSTINQIPSAKYRHSLLNEISDHWEIVRNDVIDYFRSAHQDSRDRFARLTSTGLHPAGIYQSPFSDYPFGLPQITLQGYFGEVMAAYVAEHLAPGGFSDWKVPAHLFRNHLQAFQYLEQKAQTGNVPSAIVGRTGDDCLAFRRNANGDVIAVLFCEAKCTLTHDAGLVKEAHAKISTSAIVDVLQLIEILKDNSLPDAAEWVTSLQMFHFGLHSSSQSTDRSDMICYVHSSVPVRHASWINPSTPHEAYSGGRALDVYEIRLNDVLTRLHEIYSEKVWR